ncbi:hypothetical protein BKA64DRAFT_775681 [Cadophora sp. MPI-SDFR-AT-0126]|nr:hypothetical protein BKA64DRAFT_775681 [Leotiomycetes sp. MPI-SDFR-AT-0126]
MPLLLHGRSQAEDVHTVTADEEVHTVTLDEEEILRARMHRQREADLISMNLPTFGLDRLGQLLPEDTRLAAAQRRREQENRHTRPNNLFTRPDSPIPNNNEDISSGSPFRPHVVFVGNTHAELIIRPPRTTDRASTVAYGEDPDLHNLQWNSDYGVPVSPAFDPRQPQPPTQTEPVRPNLQGMASIPLPSVQSLGRHPPVLINPAVAQDRQMQYNTVATQDWQTSYGQRMSASETPEAIYNQAPLASVRASIQNAGQILRTGRSNPTLESSGEVMAANALSSLSLAPFIDEQLRDTYISLCEEYGIYAQRYCHSLQWKVDAISVTDQSTVPPTLEPLRNIGAHMLSRDVSRLNSAAQIYTTLMKSYRAYFEVYFKSHGSPSIFPITQNQAEIPMLGEFCRILNQAENVAWHMCIQAQTGCSPEQIVALRGVALRD